MRLFLIKKRTERKPIIHKLIKIRKTKPNEAIKTLNLFQQKVKQHSINIEYNLFHKFGPEIKANLVAS